MRKHNGNGKLKRLNEAEYWDKAFLRTRNFYLAKTLAGYQQWELLRFIKQWAHPAPGIALKTDAFEEAFGNTAAMDWLAEKSHKAIGVDISFEILNSARKKMRGNNFTWSIADIADMPFASNSVDIIFSTNTYGYLTNVEEGLKEAYRVLKSQGSLIISLRNKNNVICQAARYFRKNKFPASNAFRANDFRKKLIESGFKVQECTPIVHIPPFLNPLISFLEKKNNPVFKSARAAIMRRLEEFSKKGSYLKYLTGWLIIYSAKKL